MSDVDPPFEDDLEILPPSAAEVATVDAASVHGQRKQQRKIDKDRTEADIFWAKVLDDPIGRREIWRIIAGSNAMHAFDTRFPSGPSGFPDSNAAWYARGEQDVGLRLYHELMRRDPSAVAKMHAENDRRFGVPGAKRVP